MAKVKPVLPKADWEKLAGSSDPETGGEASTGRGNRKPSTCAPATAAPATRGIKLTAASCGGGHFRDSRNCAEVGALMRLPAEIINHSCDANLRACIMRGHILYWSKRAIRPGEELTVDYWFSSKIERVPCRCGAKNCRGAINVKE
jgi:hypothetical protein